MTITWELKKTVADLPLRRNPFESHSQEQQLSSVAAYNGWEATIVCDGDGYLLTIRNMLGVTRKQCRYATETAAMRVFEDMLGDFSNSSIYQAILDR
jgi:hypothetical protein